MRLTSLILFLLFSTAGKCQSSYSGNLGNFPITLVMYHYSDGDIRAYYLYNKYDTPISLNGTLNNEILNLFEKDGKGNTSAIFLFENFTKNNLEINGKWLSSDSTKSYQVSLHKDFDIESDDKEALNTNELIQSKSTEEHYFKAIITKEIDDFYAKITGIKIFEKGTDKLIQTIELNCELFGIDNVNVGDYNFDGIEDFAVFEATYAGPNTSSIYILRDPISNKYFVSNFSGTSLEFDNELKLIYEHNQCCAGRSHMNATYKVVNNEMILIEQKCLEYDEKQEDFIEIECK